MTEALTGEAETAIEPSVAVSADGAPAEAPGLSWGDPTTAPSGGRAFWLAASDGRRLRAAVWPDGARGTVALFQGRTEFIEKFQEPISRLRGMGFAVATLDWRGQGLSERALPDPRKGHVEDFSEYQRDVDALLAHLTEIDAPKPWVLMAHSMGGAIAARALMRLNEGPTAKFAACVMSAPMLQIYGSHSFLWLAKALASTMKAFGGNEGYAVGCDRRTAADLGFKDNLLTSDEERFDKRYADVVRADDRLALGGPTWAWLKAALRETRHLEPTSTPTLILIGTDDAVVSTDAVKRYAEDGERGEVLVLAKARHEPFLETDEVQARLWAAIEAFLKDLDI